MTAAYPFFVTESWAADKRLFHQQHLAMLDVSASYQASAFIRELPAQQTWFNTHTSVRQLKVAEAPLPNVCTSNGLVQHACLKRPGTLITA